MGKGEQPIQEKEPKANKSHKTLREKLRKRRQQLKRHKKEKTQKKKQYNAFEQKLMFFQKGEGKDESQKSIKLKKIIKYIQKFINIYEDDLNEFYEMFKTLDEGGGIDISSLENKALCKCLKKLFKYLPLKKEEGEYKKIQNSIVNLENFIKNKVSQAIEYYLEHGSQQDSQESSGEEKDKSTKKTKKQKHKKVAVEEDDGIMGPIILYKNVAPQDQPQPMGPSIPEIERQKLALLFDQQMEEMKKAKQKPLQHVEDEFDQIFGMYQTRQEMRAKPKPAQLNQGVPAQLMAAGSALIGQKAQIDNEEIEEYNRIHRPKKLIQIHKEIKQSQGPEETTKRRPFKRQRDVLGEGKTQSLMTNSTFFDFKNKMSKPTTTNQFL